MTLENIDVSRNKYKFSEKWEVKSRRFYAKFFGAHENEFSVKSTTNAFDIIHNINPHILKEL